jgi:hypothetical protein
LRPKSVEGGWLEFDESREAFCFVRASSARNSAISARSAATSSWSAAHPGQSGFGGTVDTGGYIDATLPNRPENL